MGALSFTVVGAELLVPFFIFLTISLSAHLNINLIRLLIFLLTLVQLLIVSSRPITYNSDTSNYFGYIEAITSSVLVDSLSISKFEPLHLLAAMISQDFRYWLILESLMAAILIGILIWRIQRVETIAIVIGCTLPLMSSSLRFAVGLLAVSCALAIVRKSSKRIYLVTMTGALTHASLIIAGILQRRKWLDVFFIPIFFGVWVFIDPSILLRVGIEDSPDFQSTGIRTFVCLVILIAYFYFTIPSYKSTVFFSDMIFGFFLFTLSMTVSPVANRWLILLLVTIAMDSDQISHTVKTSRKLGSFVAVILYLILLVPFLYSIIGQTADGDWAVGAAGSDLLWIVATL